MGSRPAPLGAAFVVRVRLIAVNGFVPATGVNTREMAWSENQHTLAISASHGVEVDTIAQEPLLWRPAR